MTIFEKIKIMSEIELANYLAKMNMYAMENPVEIEHEELSNLILEQLQSRYQEFYIKGID